jgi:hypothetical protein
LFKTQKGLDLEIFSLKSIKKIVKCESSGLSGFVSPKIFDDRDLMAEIKEIYDGQSLLFYIRNIQKDVKKKKVWSKLHFLYDSKDYVDGDFSDEDIDMLKRLIYVAPNTIKNIKGLKLSQQLSLIKTLFEEYKEDPIIAISILEKIKIDTNNPFDEADLLLLELRVRKEIINDTKGKVKKILHPDKKEEVISDKIGFNFLDDFKINI